MSAPDDVADGSRLARQGTALAASIVLTVCSGLALATEFALRATGARPDIDGLSDMIAVREGRLDLRVSEPFFTDSEGVYRANPEYDWTTWDERGVGLNDAGFRSRPFVHESASEPRVLFIGDSFTWGASADPLTESFADQVDRAGYRVYNAGIPGTGPVQYRYLASKYIPMLRPDVVAVMFYLGNDLGAETDRMRPGQNLYHITNVGWIEAFDEAGTYLEPRAALNYHFEHTYGGTLKNRIKLQFMRSVLGSRAWIFLKKARDLIVGPEPAHRPAVGPADASLPTTRDHLREIQRIADESGARFLLFIIPVCPSREVSATTLEHNRSLFAGLDPRRPDGLERRSYDPDCGHFNNDGHDQYTQFILDELAATLASPGTGE